VFKTRRFKIVKSITWIGGRGFEPPLKNPLVNHGLTIPFAGAGAQQ
jgi:hypothetical protein